MSPIFTAFVFAAGLFIGFAINLISTRLATHKPFLGPLGCTRSRHSITFAQAFPLLGFVVQRGRCASCGKRLSPAYPLTELLTGALLAGVYWVDGWSFAFLFHAVDVAVLVLVLVIDWKHRDIYFSIIVVGCLLGLFGLFLVPGLDLFSGLVAAAVAGGFFLLAYVLARLIFPRIEEPLGLGDVLLALMMGLMLGFPNIVGALLVGPLIAGAVAVLLLVSKRSRMGEFIPYGVSLCFATIIFIIYPRPFADALHLPALVTVLGELFH